MLDFTRLRLLDQDAGLCAAVPEEDLPRARAQVVALAIDVEAGPWDPRPLLQRMPNCVGMLVIEGRIAREVLIGDRACRQLLGAGDTLLEGAAAEDAPFFPTAVEWRVVEPVRLALLGESWVRACVRWPGLGTELLHRAGEQHARLAVHQAICQLPNVEDRVRGLFLHLAGRWGRVTADGVVLPMRLTHEEIGRLVGARRSTVTLALKTLEGRESLARRDDGTWLIATDGVPTPTLAATTRRRAQRRMRGLPLAARFELLKESFAHQRSTHEARIARSRETVATAQARRDALNRSSGPSAPSAGSPR